MKLSDIKLNPDNPRVIKDDKFKKLCDSIKDFPKMMELRPIVVDEGNMVLGGNMRYKAIVELKMEEIPDSWVKKASELTDEEKKRFIIADNSEYGEWDWEIIMTNWGDYPIKDWGLDIMQEGKDFDTNNMWEGMPEYSGIEQGKAYRSIIIHFDTQEQVESFSKLLGQTITEKTRFLWYPRKEKQDIKSLEAVIKDES